MIMPHPPVRTVDPAETPVTLAEVKAHLRVEHSDEDDTLQIYLDAAVQHLDGWTGILGRCMVTQTWRQDFSDFPAGDVLRLPFAGASSVSVAYTDAEGDSQTLATTVYNVVEDYRGSALELAENQVWPVTDELPDAVQVTAVYGYGAASAVPSALKAATLLYIGMLWENREAAGADIAANRAFGALIAPYRRVGI